MFQLPPSSAKRIADSIRREIALQRDRALYRVAVHVSPSMWGLVGPSDIGPFGQAKLRLTSVPDYPAIFSLLWKLCKRLPSALDMQLGDSVRMKRITRRERWFLVHVALEAREKGLWLCDANPLQLMFHCAPKLHCVSTCYPAALVDYILARLDACCDVN
jgi:hypothetical protein